MPPPKRPWREEPRTWTRRAKRQRYDDDSVAAKSYGASDIDITLREIADVHTDFYTTFEHLVAGPKYRDQPNICAISQSLHSQFDGVQQAMRTFTEKLKDDYAAMLQGVDDAFETLEELAKEDDWWETINIFSQGMC